MGIKEWLKCGNCGKIIAEREKYVEKTKLNIKSGKLKVNVEVDHEKKVVWVTIDCLDQRCTEPNSIKIAV